MRVTTFDVCQPGFERLRNHSEIILLAYPRKGDTPGSLLEELKADLQRGEWGEGLDYDAARAALDAWFDDNARRLVVECEAAPPSSEDEELTAFVYLDVRP